MYKHLEIKGNLKIANSIIFILKMKMLASERLPVP